MVTFRERITEKMESYKDSKVEEGGMTTGAFICAVMEIDNEADAREFYDGYLGWLEALEEVGVRERAVTLARSNIGWCFGEGMKPTLRDMWVRLCGASHPVFGQTTPTADEAFAAGKAMSEGVAT